MNAVIQVETPQAAARRLAAGAIRNGLKPVALHEYCDANGNSVYWRIRCKHPGTGDKWIRPMHLTGAAYTIGEPPTPKAGKLLYRLPELLADASAPVWIVEGEACADALAKAGRVATTSGSASSAGGADWTPLEGRHVILWPDHDDAGGKYADAVAKHLHALGCTVKRVDVAALGLPEHGDVVDWLESNDADGLDTLPMVPAPFLAPNEGPEPLRRAIPPAPAYPFDALGPVLGKAARRIHQVVQAPDAICGQSVLAAASLAVQAMANVAIDGRTHPLSLWCITVAESGERKSAADHWALHAHVEFERERVVSYASESKVYRLALEAHEDASKAAKGKAKDKGRTGIMAALEAVGEAPEPPLLPQLLCSEPTLEGLHKLLQNGFPSIGLFTDEAGQLFGGHAMSKDNMMKSAAGLSKLWDGAAIDRIRAGDGAVKLYGKRLALHAMMQPVVAEVVLSNDMLTGQGFLARALLASPQGLAGYRSLSDADLSTDPDLAHYWRTMRNRLERPLPMQADTRNELNPRALPLTADARTRWATVYAAIESDQAPGGEYSQVKAWANKAPEQVLRIAGVLAMVADPDASHITGENITNAARLVEWNLGEAVRLVGMAATQPEVKHAEAILDWARERGLVHVHSRQLIQFGPNCIRDADTLHAAMRVLEAAHWAVFLEDGMALDGAHRRNVWRLVKGD